VTVTEASSAARPSALSRERPPISVPVGAAAVEHGMPQLNGRYPPFAAGKSTNGRAGVLPLANRERPSGWTSHTRTTQWVVGPSGTTVKVALTRPVTVIFRAHVTRGDEDVSTLLNYALVERPNGGCGRTDSLVASRFGTLPRPAGEAWAFDSIAFGARLQ